MNAMGAIQGGHQKLTIAFHADQRFYLSLPVKQSEQGKNT
jgi:hypothetical protein